MSRGRRGAGAEGHGGSVGRVGIHVTHRRRWSTQARPYHQPTATTSTMRHAFSNIKKVIEEMSEKVARDDVRATLEVQKQTPTPVRALHLLMYMCGVLLCGAVKRHGPRPPFSLYTIPPITPTPTYLPPRLLPTPDTTGLHPGDGALRGQLQLVHGLPHVPPRAHPYV